MTSWLEVNLAHGLQGRRGCACSGGDACQGARGGGRRRRVLPDVTVEEGSVESMMGQLLAIQPASPSSMLAHIAVIGRDCRGILDLPLAAPAHQDQREHLQGRLGVRISPARYHVRYR